MHVVTLVLVFLLAVVVSGFIVRLLPLKLPLPLVQIALGACLSWIGYDVEFDPHLFLLLFIPPLLFLDGWRIPKGAFFRDWKPILALAIGLVVFTVVGIGWFIYWLVPAVPLAVAFALAAILSPTDPVAVGAMTANSPLPPRLMHILEGESLLNDATGLVCFSFAVAAAMSGHFSLAEASMSFLLVAGGGLFAGVAVTWIIGRLNRILVQRTGEDPGIQILISLLIPFAAYLVAEHVHVSGILAAAVAGIAMHYGELSGRPLASTRMQRSAVWDTVQTALNGIIFVLLGDQLPRMLRQLPQAAAASGSGNDISHLVGYVVVITLALGMLRFAWVWGAARIAVSIAAWRGKAVAMPGTRPLGVFTVAVCVGVVLAFLSMGGYAAALVVAAILGVAALRLRSRKMSFGDDGFRYDGWVTTLRTRYDAIGSIDGASSLGWPEESRLGPTEYRFTLPSGKPYQLSLLWFGAEAAAAFREKVAARPSDPQPLGPEDGELPS